MQLHAALKLEPPNPNYRYRRTNSGLLWELEGTLSFFIVRLTEKLLHH
jgi:hypothetical protein